MKDLDWSDVLDDADRMRDEQMEREYEAWAAEHAEEIDREAYVAWCEREEREPYADADQDTAWLDYIDSLIPDDPW